MKEPAQETIAVFAQRSNGAVTRVTMAFALGGAILDIGAHVVSSLFMNGVGVSMLWGVWIPLCFITIPPIHYLCRHVQGLQDRIASLEARLEAPRAA